MIRQCILWGVIVCLYAPLSFATSPPGKTYTFAVVPQHAASKIVRLWTPILDWIGQHSGHQLKVVTAKNIPEFERQLAAGHYDFAYMNPYHFVVFNQSPGYQALAHQKNKRIKGIIVTHKDSPYQSLKELSGSKLAFPSPAAFAASLLTRASLQQGDVSFTPQYVSSHDSVYMTVAKGIFPAGGGVVRTLNNMPEEIRTQLRVLWESPGYTPHAIASHPRIPEQVRIDIQQALLSMGQQQDSMQLLKALSFKQGFSEATNATWDDIRALNIQHKTAGAQP